MSANRPRTIAATIHPVKGGHLVAPEQNVTPPRVSRAFWDWPPLKAAFAARHMGRVSKQYRRNPAHGRTIGQRQLARWLNRTQSAVSRMETATEAPHDARVLADFVVVLDIPRELLWFDAPDPESPSDPAPAPVDRDRGTAT